MSEKIPKLAKISFYFSLSSFLLAIIFFFSFIFIKQLLWFYFSFLFLLIFILSTILSIIISLIYLKRNENKKSPVRFLSINFLSLVLITIVITPYFNFSILDSQCEVLKDRSGGTVCLTTQAYELQQTMNRASGTGSFPAIPPESICNRDCESRLFRCGFNQAFKEVCVNCVRNCELNSENHLLYNTCIDSCRSS